MDGNGWIFDVSYGGNCCVFISFYCVSIMIIINLINCYIGDNRSLKCKDSGMMVQAADRLTLQTCLMRFFRI